MDFYMIFSAMETKDKVTATISLLNIVTTIVLALVNNYYATKSKKESLRRDALCNYYLKVLNLTNDILFAREIAYSNSKDINLFSPKNAMESSLVKGIIEQYEKFDIFVRTNTPSYSEPSIDTLIQESLKHVHFVLKYQQANREEKKVYEKNISKYSMDVFQPLIDEIKGWLEL